MKLRELMERVEWGEEFLFTYQNDSYWISQNMQGYYLTCVEDEYTQKFITAKDLFEKARIHGQTLLQIWNDIKDQF